MDCILFAAERSVANKILTAERSAVKRVEIYLRIT